VLGVWTLNTNVTGMDALVGEAIAKAGFGGVLEQRQQCVQLAHGRGSSCNSIFPPAWLTRPPGPLVGVNFSQLAFSDITKQFKGPGTVISYGSSPGLTIVPHRRCRSPADLRVRPGGVRSTKAVMLVGAWASRATASPPRPSRGASSRARDSDEDVALAGRPDFNRRA